MDENEIKIEKSKTEIENYLNNIVSIIPENPGCYQYFDEKGNIIYIGKAKNLKKRVSSYFNKKHSDIKTTILVMNIRDIKYVIVDNEEDALLLENSLIKQYQPKYNVILKDDKTYPSIVIKNEEFPRIFQTRNVVKDGSLYFGPYASAHSAKVMLQMIREIFPIRNCKLNLTPENICKGKFKTCLQYHIKKCKGPCEGLQDLEEYNDNISQVKEILKGNISMISKILYQNMLKYAKELKFEEAQTLKMKYNTIENFKAKSKIVIPSLNNIDVFSFCENESSAFINYMHIGNGAIVQVYSFEYRKKLNEPKEELLGLGIIEMRKRYDSSSEEIIVPFIPDIEVSMNRVTFTVPKIGDKKKLLDLSEKNVIQYQMDKQKQAEKINPDQNAMRVLNIMQKDLKMNKPPAHIECFDNSNIQGTNPVASCVVFKKTKPSKKDYRHFHIKTVEGPNDFASMIEVVRRRYTRLIKEEKELPQLIVIDGGKGQLSAAKEVIDELGIIDKVTIIGLAKRLEEIYFPGDSIPLILNKTSETLKVIQQIRDEAHRFGIKFHRNLRSKDQIKSKLDSIKGIGNKTKLELLRKYGSIKGISEAPFEELQKMIGKYKANILINGLKENK